VTGTLADTGFLVALFRRRDRLRAAARSYLQAHSHPLATVAPVIVETSFFLDARGKADLLEWVLRGGLTVAEVPHDAYRELKALVLKYADRDIDFADAALIWLAGVSGCPRILTVDERDFGIYRLKGNKRFDIVGWRRR
jgi:predicted nucleic acid-binding protein